MKNILVLGAGISGLSCAYLLKEAGHSVTIWAKELTLDTTSSVAAAFWYPYLVNPREKAIPWAKNTYAFLEGIMADPLSRVRYIDFIDYLKEPTPDPWWVPAVETFEHPPQEELLPGFVDAFRARTIVMETPGYLHWLLGKLEGAGVSIHQKAVSSFDEIGSEYDTIINCTGLGSKELCHDEELYPVRGQVVRVKANGFDHIVTDESSPENLSYVVPRFEDVILGGTVQVGDWNREVDPQDTENILRKAGRFIPSFAGAEPLEVRVGLRPARSSVRLEAETISGRTVIHNYGHGGAGFTLSWGCAQDVRDLV